MSRSIDIRGWDDSTSAGTAKIIETLIRNPRVEMEEHDKISNAGLVYNIYLREAVELASQSNRLIRLNDNFEERSGSRRQELLLSATDYCSRAIGLAKEFLDRDDLVAAGRVYRDKVWRRMDGENENRMFPTFRRFLSLGSLILIDKSIDSSKLFYTLVVEKYLGASIGAGMYSAFKGFEAYMNMRSSMDDSSAIRCAMLCVIGSAVAYGMGRIIDRDWPKIKQKICE